MNRAADYIFVGHNSISNKWEVRLNSHKQSEHDSFTCAENAAIETALAINDQGKTCSIVTKVQPEGATA